MCADATKGGRSASVRAVNPATARPLAPQIYHFLIDECLTVKLAVVALQAGHTAQTVPGAGLKGTKDPALMPILMAQKAVFVTRNAKDFRGKGERSPGGLHAQHPGHAGLVLLNGDNRLVGGVQVKAFQFALSKMATQPTMTGQALEVWLQPDGAFRATLYPVPVLPRTST